MTHMFDNYPQPEGYVPCNRPRPHCKHKITIMSGETATHSFEVPFNVETDCSNVEVIYRLGVENIIIKNKEELTIFITEHGSSLISCSLTSEETNLFKNTLLSAHVQLKFYMSAGDIAFSDIYKVYVEDSLDDVGS